MSHCTMCCRHSGGGEGSRKGKEEESVFGGCGVLQEQQPWSDMILVGGMAQRGEEGEIDRV